MGKMKPILFSTPMVQAILSGKKTETRRVIKKPEPHSFDLNGKQAYAEDPYGDWHKVEEFSHYRPNDILWVRETFCFIDDTEYGGEKWIDYRATPKYSSAHPAGWENEPDSPEALKWKPSIFMPKEACRLFLEVVSSKAERLQDITEQDARAEGIIDGGCLNCGESEPCMCDNPKPSAKDAFIYLWNSINEKRGYSWVYNPWVWAIKFEIKEIKQSM